MNNGNTDRNLLIGILALQMDFINRDQLIEAMHAWVLDKSESLDELLHRQEAIAPGLRDLILALVEKHLELHQGEAGQSLAAVSSISSSVREQLISIADSEVEASLALLSLNEDNASPLTTSTIDVGASSAEGLRFRVLRPHARGGLGQVSVALDQELHREVALKEIQAQHADSPDSRSRFVMEAEITGGLEHPGIVPVYGLGTYSDGRPFYAMRFIRGDSLKEAIDGFHQRDGGVSKLAFGSLAFRKLLGRFVDVCNAIEYAHSRGVLHRDLKPGNIMLGKYGETLVVDWGLSKVIGRHDVETKADEPTLRVSSGSGSAPTQMGLVLGTPAYMSPEQAEGRVDQLGPVSDVYSLGATLYCLLVGRPPFEQQDMAELLRKVQAGVFTKPRELNVSIPRPLEAVCLKAMALKTEERYVSPRQLANEIEHWMADEPVEAYPEPLTVRTWRWVRCHKAQVVSAAAIALIGVVSLGVVAAVIASSNRRLSQANRQLDDANTQLADANTQLADANESLEKRNDELKEANELIKAAETIAKEERNVAVSLNQFVCDDLLGKASPLAEPDREVKLRTVLDRAAVTIGNRFSDQPLVEASIRRTIGKARYALGEYESAEHQLDRVSDLLREHVGEEHDSTLATMNDLARVYRGQARYHEAESLVEQTLETSRRNLGDEHPSTLVITDTLASVYQDQCRYNDSEKLREEVLKTQTRVLGDEHPSTLSTMVSLAVTYTDLDRYDDATELLEKVLSVYKRDFGDEHPNTLVVMQNLAGAYGEQGRVAQAEAMFRDSLSGHKRVFGGEHPSTADVAGNLGALLRTQGRYDEAEPLFEEGLTILRSKLGTEHPKTISMMKGQVLTLLLQQNVDIAVPIAEELLALPAEKRGNCPLIEAFMAAHYSRLRQYSKAIPLLEKSLDNHESLTADLLVTIRRGLVQAYMASDQHAKTESILVENVRLSRERNGDVHKDTAFSLLNLGNNLLVQEKYSEAEVVLRECLEIYKKLFPDTWLVPNNKSLLGEALAGQDMFAEAEPLIVGGFERLSEQATSIPDVYRRPCITAALQRAVDLYTAWGKPDEAAKWQEKLTQLETKTDEEALSDITGESSGDAAASESDGVSDG